MDPYALLGVPRSASASQIERAYRRLARRYHPGINPGDSGAAEIFQQIEAAFAVLGDADRRRDYDRGRAGSSPDAHDEATVAFEGFDFTASADGQFAATFSELFADVFQEAARAATSPGQRGDVEIRLELSFEHAIRGGTFPLSVTRQDRCASCDGQGRVGRPSGPCPACAASGTRRWARGHMVFSTPCELCGGSGRLVSQPCRTCGGRGTLARSEVVSITLPPGVESGARVVVPGRGHAGGRGGRAGDLYVLVAVHGHRVFERRGPDLHVTLPVAVHEAALGARVRVPTLDGSVSLKIPPGTSSGTVLRLRGRGVPGPDGADGGDLLAEVRIVLPPVTDEHSKELLREFGRRNDADVRRHLFEARDE